MQFTGHRSGNHGLWAVMLMLASAAAAYAMPADTLFLKDNTTRIGKIIARDSAYTTIRTAGDMLVISESEIARIGREVRRDLLLPEFAVYLNAGISNPSQFDFPSGIGMRAGVRYMLTRSIGLNAGVTYASWQINYDTILPPGPNHNIKDPVAPVTRTFAVSAVSPRVGAFMAMALSPTTRFLLGVDVGQTYVSVSSPDTTTDTQTGFSYAVRGDLRFGLTERFALLVGAQYEGFPTSFVALEQHDVTVASTTHRIGDVLLSAGVEVGF